MKYLILVIALGLSVCFNAKSAGTQYTSTQYVIAACLWMNIPQEKWQELDRANNESSDEQALQQLTTELIGSEIDQCTYNGQVISLEPHKQAFSLYDKIMKMRAGLPGDIDLSRYKGFPPKIDGPIYDHNTTFSEIEVMTANCGLFLQNTQYPGASLTFCIDRYQIPKTKYSKVSYLYDQLVATKRFFKDD
ncbi:hypothetical protein L2750_13075 [Shewanella submarina]|uniref:Uncharacterized protein n=1 Tax=Shewanella submarina TaxID=2016376 RepID=A0ABV7GDZ3_9GAMM|nr:hypothetical protein [Shewanella submarina]MCL1038082.1 hypothetical protein [Shewanella submarina]